MLPLIITVAAAFVILVLTTTVMGPVALRMARPKVWQRRVPAPDFGREGQIPSGPTFEPLDLGPDPVRWPSETPWPHTARPELPWPSMTWNDPHFGLHWRTHGVDGASDAAFEAAQEARRSTAARQRKHDESKRKVRGPERAAAQPTEESGLKTRARQEMRQMRERASQLQAEAQETVGRVAKEQAKKAAVKAVERVSPKAAALAQTVPSPAQLEQMVTEIGLAGTVQEIMRRTGWDFKTAAQHLAKARRGR